MLVEYDVDITNADECRQPLEVEGHIYEVEARQNNFLSNIMDAVNAVKQSVSDTANKVRYTYKVATTGTGETGFNTFEEYASSVNNNAQITRAIPDVIISQEEGPKETPIQVLNESAVPFLESMNPGIDVQKR